jgi:hypothetical protein
MIRSQISDLRSQMVKFIKFIKFIKFVPDSAKASPGLDFKAKLCHFIPNFDLKISTSLSSK